MTLFDKRRSFAINNLKKIRAFRKLLPMDPVEQALTERYCKAEFKLNVLFHLSCYCFVFLFFHALVHIFFTKRLSAALQLLHYFLATRRILICVRAQLSDHDSSDDSSYVCGRLFRLYSISIDESDVLAD